MLETKSPTFAVTVVSEFLLLEERVALHLVHGWHYLSRLQQCLSLSDGEVEDANCPSQAFAKYIFNSL